METYLSHLQSSLFGYNIENALSAIFSYLDFGRSIVEQPSPLFQAFLIIFTAASRTRFLLIRFKLVVSIFVTSSQYVMPATTPQPSSAQGGEDQLVEHRTNQQVEDIIRGGCLNFLNRQPGYQLLSFCRPLEMAPSAVNVITFTKCLV
jgi:hypothetical protein